MWLLDVLVLICFELAAELLNEVDLAFACNKRLWEHVVSVCVVLHRFLYAEQPLVYIALIRFTAARPYIFILPKPVEQLVAPDLDVFILHDFRKLCYSQEIACVRYMLCEINLRFLLFELCLLFVYFYCKRRAFFVFFSLPASTSCRIFYHVAVRFPVCSQLLLVFMKALDVHSREYCALLPSHLVGYHFTAFSRNQVTWKRLVLTRNIGVFNEKIGKLNFDFSCLHIFNIPANISDEVIMALAYLFSHISAIHNRLPVKFKNL